MRILVNRLTALRRRTGIGHYVAHLLDALGEVASPGDRVDVYPGLLAERSLGGLRALKRKKTSGAGQRDGRLGRLLARMGRSLTAWHFRIFYGWRGFDVYHEPNAIPLPSALATVATVCDLSVLLRPHWHPADRVAYYEKQFPAGLSRCDHVLTISAFSKQEIVRNFGVAPERVTVTYPGIAPAWRPLPAQTVDQVRARLGLPEKYLLHVGTLEPRKNLLMLMKAYVGLPPALREACPLLLAGGWGWNVDGLRTYYEEKARHRGVRCLGYVADDDLPALYNGARALVYPTHYEGFGLPPLEMLACGGAVLASRAEAVVETAGQGAHLLDVDDEDGWRDALRRLIIDEGWRQELRRGGPEVAAPFTWRRCAEETWRVYRAVGEKRQAA